MGKKKKKRWDFSGDNFTHDFYQSQPILVEKKSTTVNSDKKMIEMLTDILGKERIKLLFDEFETYLVRKYGLNSLEDINFSEWTDEKTVNSENP